jgi:protein gp37
MAVSSIEWTEVTWNPATGCTKISAGCNNCYAERMAKRFKAMGVAKYEAGFSLKVHPEVLEEPYSWNSPRTVFVNSMSDLFHKDIPFQFIQDVFRVMNETPKHTYQVLTKRSDRLKQLGPLLNWTENIWMGVSVEDQTAVRRIEDLLAVGAEVRFLSIEPLISRISDLKLHGIDWVIVGGESGPGARPMNEEWVTEIRDQCISQTVPFFFKQWGGTNKKKTGRILEGRTWNEMPIREVWECVSSESPDQINDRGFTLTSKARL